jgi:Integrase zinc binding domain/RNase H-like domain found in reverse transcriptase
LNPAQTRYTTTERELLSIVETLKEFRNILLGQCIQVYTDHKNLTFSTFNTERVMRWRLIIEEYAPEFIYLKGEHNIVADALSRLELDGSTTTSDEIHDIQYLADHFALDDDDLPDDAFPLQYKQIALHQRKDKDLMSKLHTTSTGYQLKAFCGGGKKRDLICCNDKIVIPSTLQKRVVEWYHSVLSHPGETRTEQTLRQYLWWNNLRNDVHDVCTKCHIFQKTKRTTKKYGHLPVKEAESTPWDILCVDLIGPLPLKDEAKRTSFYGVSL